MSTFTLLGWMLIVLIGAFFVTPFLVVCHLRILAFVTTRNAARARRTLERVLDQINAGSPPDIQAVNRACAALDKATYAHDRMLTLSRRWGL